MNKYGFKEHEWEEVLRILSNNKAIDKAILFGSRAMNTFKPMSDVDIVIYGDTLKYSDSSKLMGDFEESDLPFMFDIVNFNTIKSKELIEHIEKYGVSVYQKGWCETTIGEYADVLSGFAFKSKDFVERKIDANYLPIIKIKNVANGDVNFNEVVYHKVDANTEKYILETDDILIALTGNHPFAKTQVVGGVSRYRLKQKSLLNQRVGKIYSKDRTRINDAFIYYFFKWERTHLYLGNQSGGSASQANISKTDVLNTPIYLPPLSQQKQIATILSTLDQKIALLKKQNQTLEELAQTLFKRWFVDFEFPNEQGKPYKSSGGKMIASELGEIPEGWSVDTLSKVVDVINGYSYKGVELQESDVAMVTLKNFDRNGGFRFDGFKELKSDRYKEKHIAKQNDLVVAHTDLTQDAEVLGNPALIQPHSKYKEFVISMDLVKVVSKNEDINTPFLYYLMKERRFKSHCIGYSNGTTVLHLNKLAIPEFELALPDKSNLVIEFGKYANETRKKITINTQQVQSFKQLRDTLLPKLMSGKITIEK